MTPKQCLGKMSDGYLLIVYSGDVNTAPGDFGHVAHPYLLLIQRECQARFMQTVVK